MRLALRIVLALGVVAGAACSKQTPANEPSAPLAQASPAAETETAAADQRAQAQAAEEAKRAEAAKAEEEQRQKVAARIAEFEADHQKEVQRWTDAVKKKVARLAKRSFKNTKVAMAAILPSPHRSPESQARDKYRHPAKTLAFFGITPKMTVVEMGAGAGWYTEILAPLLAKHGKLRATTGDPSGPDTDMQTAYGKRFAMWKSLSPELYGAVEEIHVDPAQMVLGPPDSADAVVAIREMHNWVRHGQLGAYLAAMHAVLEPGGILGVVQHRAPEGAVAADSAKKGYLPQKWLIEQIEAAGFELVATSEINANPKDTKDYEKGVWTLPPTLRLGEKDRAKYEAIGESDRMTLKFKKIPKRELHVPKDSALQKADPAAQPATKAKSR